ncbi:MAG TPA: autotransporter-associated beta strand repeat-containing protein, partial [Pirellulales bacterium]|nr:autotransporter-associated beta strand repeat-containing protein [Pirellulales bacterium]
SITDASGFGSAAAGTPNSLIKTGAGTLALLGSNTYSGGTTIDAGTLQINSNTSLGAIGSLATINAGTLEAVANIDTTRSFALGSSSSTILVDSGLTYTVGGVISETSPNTGALNATGGGTLVLSGTNTYSLGTNVSNGTVSVSSDGNLGDASGGVTLSSGGTLAVTTGFSSDRDFTVGSGGGALNVTSGQTFTASGAGTWSGNSSGGTLTLSGGGTVQLNTGSASYGSTGSPLSISVAAGTLSGTATVIGNITINSGGTVSPATSTGAPATLTFEGSGAGTATLNSGGNFAMNLADASGGSTLTSLGAGAGSNWNLLAVSSLADNLSSIALFNLTVSGSLNNFNPAQAYQWDFITSAGGLNGVTANEFNLINGLPTEPGTFSIAVGNTLPGGAGYVALDYSPSAVPEPGSMALAGLAALGMTGLGWRQRRRRNPPDNQQRADTAAS